MKNSIPKSSWAGARRKISARTLVVLALAAPGTGCEDHAQADTREAIDNLREEADLLAFSFEEGPSGWTGDNVLEGPWAVSEWAKDGGASLKADVWLSNRRFALRHVGDAPLGRENFLVATVRRSAWGSWGPDAAARLYVKTGEGWTYFPGAWRPLTDAAQGVDLTLDLSDAVEFGPAREFGVELTSDSSAAERASVYVDDVGLLAAAPAAACPGAVDGEPIRAELRFSAPISSFPQVFRLRAGSPNHPDHFTTEIRRDALTVLNATHYGIRTTAARLYGSERQWRELDLETGEVAVQRNFGPNLLTTRTAHPFDGGDLSEYRAAISALRADVALVQAGHLEPTYGFTDPVRPELLGALCYLDALLASLPR